MPGNSLKRAGSSSGSLSRAASAELARPASAGGEGAADPGSPVQAGSLWRLPGAKPHDAPTLLGAAEQAGHFGRRRRCYSTSAFNMDLAPARHT